MFIVKYLIFGALFVFLGVLLTAYLSPRDELKRVDAIVAISGGKTTDRAQQATRLYQENWSDQLVFSGAALDPLSPSNAEIMREFAKRTGIPEGVIRIEEQAKNTVQNASQSQEIIEEQEYESIILVTSPYHQRRAYLEFRDKLGPDVEIINFPVEDDNWATTWWFKPSGWQTTITETFKVGATIVKNMF